MSSSNWFYAANGQQHGPVPAATLKSLADSGQLRPDDLVCQEGSEQWVAASRLEGLFTAQSTPLISNQPVQTLPQIQINVGKAIKGIGTTVQGVAESQPVKDAAAAVQNVAGQAAAGVGNFIRSDAVQSQVGAANNFWSNLSTQHKLIAVGVAGCGLLMMFCVVATIGSWMLGGGGGNGSSESGGNESRFTAPSSSGSGRKWTMAQVHRVKGSQTPEEVIAILGKPDVRETVQVIHESGTMLMFRYRADRRPEEFRQHILQHGADPDVETTLGFLREDGKWRLKQMDYLRPLE